MGSQARGSGSLGQSACLDGFCPKTFKQDTQAALAGDPWTDARSESHSAEGTSACVLVCLRGVGSQPGRQCTHWQLGSVYSHWGAGGVPNTLLVITFSSFWRTWLFPPIL
jgi:hypothetical protein